MPSTTRRQLLAASVASSLLAGCLTGSRPDGSLESVDGRWPMDGRDSGHSRRAGDAPSDPDPVWQRSLDGVRAVGPPALTGGRLYVPADAVTGESRSRYRLYALGANAGETQWQVPLRVEPNGSPAVAPDRIIVSGKRSVERGRVVCFRPKYGEEKWLYDIDARLTAPPTVANGMVYIGDWAGRVHALGALSGDVRWTQQVDADDGGREFTTAVAVDDGTAYLGSLAGNTGIIALDADTGEEQWRASTGPVTVGPVVDDGLVVVQSHGLVSAFGAGGSERWTFNVPAESSRPMAVDSEHVYIAGEETLYAIDRSGRAVWRDSGADGQPGTPTVAGDSVLLRSENRLRALRAADGTEQWTATPAGNGGPVVVPSGVFLQSTDGRLLALGEN